MIEILFLFVILFLMAIKGIGEYIILCNQNNFSAIESMLMILVVLISTILIAFLLFVALNCRDNDKR